MKTDFILPDIGEGIVECEIVQWLVAEGDQIEEDQPVAEVSTDKAIVEIPAVYSGKVLKLYYAAGDIAKVHQPLFALEREDDSAGDGPAPQQPADTTADQTPAPARTPPREAPSEPSPDRPAGKVLTTPAVRRMAREHDLDLSQVPATGKNDRVLKEDVLAYISGRETGTNAPAPRRAASGDRVEPIRGPRAVMARAMAEAVATIPHFTYVDEIDLTALIQLRSQLKERFAEQGVRLTMMPLFMKALSLALHEYPILNSSPNEDCTELRYSASHNIGMAVDSRVGLLVPNVKNVQELTLLELAGELNRLTEVAREGRVAPADLRDGTITISNVGAVGGTVATPIINKPEVAIVALGKLQSLPRFNSRGEVEARQLMTASWSGDHRIIDGATMARFSNTWKGFLEEPSSMLAAMR
ncbi:dihydrolipoyllysine-residue acetyltransferase [Seongchinamella sediminis]|uniref:Dihydrolipoamide acetyltransferase component of pyruvate dehydrogenase complex n=1 Tax=Seongchinamella sediminis TaxID=2283635 RepID=A0A3L7E2H9_9GAMM|nr:2-oxo acid dehydrogenase subunit E2 [Seongchinamella sediminis]RLQ22573.1 dihydrolipoyllysine-residue acetyltransferase [Seongchinamella sediminis]